MRTYNLFATPIYQEHATLENYDAVQLEIKAVLDEITKSNDYSLVSYTHPEAKKQRQKEEGYVIKDNIILEKKLVNLEARINSAIDHFAMQSGWFGLNRPGKFVIDNSWLNINGKGVHHEYHSHPGYTIGGCYYFRVSELQGGINFNNPNQMMYNLAFPGGNRYPGSINILPKDGDLILFPAWLQHSTDVNRSDEDRISLAFNIEYVLE